MNKLFATLGALMCFTVACGAAPDQNTIAADLQNRYSWIPQNEVPVIKTREDTYYKFNVTYPKSKVFLQLDENGNLVSAHWNNGGSPEERGDYVSLVNEEFVWNLRPDLPKDKMIRIFDGYYCYKRPDGVIDPGVMMMMYNSSGMITGFTSNNNPYSGPLPPVSITEADARKIGNSIAANFVCDNGKGVTVSWPYYYEQHPEWAEATIRLDDVNGTYTAYDLTYRLGNEPDLVFNEENEEKTHSLPILNMRINASTGDLVYVKRDFYKSTGELTGTKTNKPASQYPAILFSLNAKDAKLGFPLVVVKNTTYVAMPTLQSLAKGHAVAAKAGAKAFSLDGKQLALDAKVLDRKGVLYLPWQSLNSLPGVKAQFDAKLAKLSITTTAATQNASAK